jgi:hypothetical protein
MEIVSDNASVFKSQVFRSMCFRWVISLLTTTRYRPCPNHVERFNRNLKAAVSIFHNSLQTAWDQSLPYFTLALNTAWHESTRQTPAKRFLCRDLLDPLDFPWKVTEVLGSLRSFPVDSMGIGTEKFAKGSAKRSAKL